MISHACEYSEHIKRDLALLSLQLDGLTDSYSGVLKNSETVLA